LKFFQSELAKNRDDVDSLYGLAVTQDKLGLTALSLENFQKALTLNSDDNDILRELGIVYLKSGRPGEALQYLRKVVARDANDAIALSYLAKSYEADGNYPAAIQIYKELVAKNSTDPEVFYNLAFAYGKTSNPGDSHYNFGIYFKKKDKSASSLFHFKEALKYFPPGSPQARDIEQQMKPPSPADNNNELMQQEPRRSPREAKGNRPYQSVGGRAPSWRIQDKSFP
jgi:tetratricopeptide (TPR) repeat protein